MILNKPLTASGCKTALWRLGVKRDILKLLYNMNKITKIRVKTPYGLTDACIVEDIVEQGTVLAPVLCSSSTSEYCETNKGIAVGTSQVSSFLFVNDAVDLSGTKHDG